MKAKMFLVMGVMMCLAQVSMAQNLKVKVPKVGALKGTVYMSLFNSEESFLSKPFRRDSVKVADTEFAIEFKDLPAGTYAVSVFHDENGDGEMNYGMMGIPQEAFGFSNNPSISVGPPSFEESKFDLTEDKEIVVNMMLIRF